MITILQVTLGSGATQVSSTQVYAKWVQFQNNGANSMRMGDPTVSSTQGIVIAAGGGFFDPPLRLAEATDLSQWYVAGTLNDKLDIVYDSVNF